MTRIQIGSDCSILVKAMKGTSYDLSPSGVLFQDARMSIESNFVKVEFKHCYRIINQCAHEIARFGMSWDPGQNCLWFDPLPEFISILMTRDLARSTVNE